LKRAGLVKPRCGRFRAPPTLGGLTQAERPNHVWATDHKGWFLLGDKERCEPLTISGSLTRFLIGTSAGDSTCVVQARAEFERALVVSGSPYSSSPVCSNSCWILRDDRPFAQRTKSLTDMCGGISTNIWTWSLDHFFITTHSHIFLERDYPTSNFIVSRTGNSITARRCVDQAELIDRINMPADSVVRWKGNRIEYLYPLDLLSAAFGARVTSHNELIINNDRVSANGIIKTKKDLAVTVTAGLTSLSELPREIEDKLINPIRRAILPD